LVAGLLLEVRDQHVEESGVLGRRRRGEQEVGSRRRWRWGRGGRGGRDARRRRRGRLGRRTRREDDRYRDQSDDAAHDGTSTMTFVALITQMTWSPGFSFSSRTDSAVRRLSRRYGPACTSTVAATRSATTFVTTPGSRFRADWAAMGLSGTDLRRAPSVRLTSAADTRRCPPPERFVLSVPSAAQRRIVSTDTPRISAAWPIRRAGRASLGFLACIPR